MNALRHPRTSVLGIVLGLVVIGALFARPTWGPADLTQFAGGVAVILLGLWARDPGGPSGKAPPPASTVLLPVLALTLSGCADGCVTAKGVKTLFDAFGPLACSEVVPLITGKDVVGVVCPGIQAFVDGLLSAPPAGAVGAAPSCRRRLVIVDASGQRVGFACEAHAVAIAARIQGRTEAP